METISYWYGEPVNNETPKETLLEIIKYLSQELEITRKDRSKWMKHGDAAAYLLDRSE